MQSVGVLTSGGDASGMNAAIRAVARTAVAGGLRTFSIRDGFEGLIRGDFHRLHARSVGNILQRGGTVIGTSRSQDFETQEGRARAAGQLRAAGIDALVAIGGDGTIAGCNLFYREQGVPVIAIPATIDNDVPGTDFSIGFDTAVNAAVEAMDRIRDTAEASGRVFFIEVMGRKRGFIALYAGLSGGADAILIPEELHDLDALCDRLVSGRKGGKKSLIVVVAEGDEAGGAFSVAEQVRERLGNRIPLNYRVTVLGHVQRGGVPTPADRVLGTVLGAGAVDGLGNGIDHHMVGEVNGRTVYTPLDQVLAMQKDLPQELLRLLHAVG
ncbi:MAG: ATP-dependent 6-phosphofructokinase [Chloroflexi bacterium]|nr:ATP-dependent 6-phosphofructokinase [Chloroflexota bacterium]